MRDLSPPFVWTRLEGGHSNLTYAVAGADGRRFVLRRPPTGAVLATAHDMRREHRILSALWGSEVPVPQTLALCKDEAVNDAPFYVMEFVDGAVLESAADADREVADPAARRRLGERVIEVLGALHSIDPDAVGLGDLGRKEAYLERQLKRWKTQWEKSKTRDLSSMDRAYALLVERRPEQRYTGVVHGDYRLGNMLVDGGGELRGVLDWELCTLGDTLADVGYLLDSWGLPGDEPAPDPTATPTAAGGFASRDELLADYARVTGRDLDGIEYYQAFQYWRLAAIIEGVYSRYLKGVMGDPDADTAAFRLRVERLAEQSLDCLGRLDG